MLIGAQTQTQAEKHVYTYIYIHADTHAHTHRTDTHTHLLRTDIANSDVECIFRAKALQLNLTGKV